MEHSLREKALRQSTLRECGMFGIADTSMLIHFLAGIAAQSSLATCRTR